MQSLDDRGFGGGRTALLVGVLDAQDELATLAAGKDAVEQRHVGGADMRIPGGAGCNAGSDGHGISIAMMPRRNGAGRAAHRALLGIGVTPQRRPGQQL